MVKKNKIKILNIVTSGLFVDGISNSVMNYYRNLDKDLIQMDFLVPDAIESMKEEIEKNGNKIYFLKDRTRKPITYIKKLYKIIKDNNYDIVQAHGSSAILSLEMLAAQKAKCKVRVAHSRNTTAQHRILDKILRPLFYMTYTDGFACGEEAGRWLFGNRKFHILNNGKDTERFKFNSKIREEMRKEYNLVNKKVIGHVGRFNEQKNHEFLIDVFYNLVKANPEYHLVLVGDGHLFNEINDKVKKLGIEDNVLFVGQSTEIEKWLQAMDIMVFPSRYEGFPNVLIEWQISGLPCLISDKITREVAITNLVRFASIEDIPETWVKAIEEIKLKDRTQTDYDVQVREAGYDIKENAKKLEKIYIELVKDK